MIVRFLKLKILALLCGTMLLQAGSCSPTVFRPFGELTQTGGSLVGMLIVPQLPG